MPVTTITIRIEDSGTALHVGGAAPPAITEAVGSAITFEEAPPPGPIGEVGQGYGGEEAAGVESEGPPPQDLAALGGSVTTGVVVDTTAAAPPPEDLVQVGESDEESIEPMPIEDLDKKPSTRAKKS